MLAPITGTLTKIFPPEQIEGRQSFKQRIEITEYAIPNHPNSKDKHFGIDVFYNDESKMQDLAIEDYRDKRVKAECYWNGYRYTHRVHGQSYGVNITLKNLELLPG